MPGDRAWWPRSAPRPATASRGTATSTSCLPVPSTRGDTTRGPARSTTTRLVGRGAADMKGPIGAALAAASALRRAATPLAGSLVFHLAADEELAGVHGTKVLWERGLLVQDAAIVGEPSELQVGIAERGGAWFTATAFGRAAHGSQPHRRERDHVDGALPAAAVRRAPRPRTSPRGPTHGERRPDRRRQRPQRRPGPMRGRYRPPHRAGRVRSRRRAHAVPGARRVTARRAPRGRDRASGNGPTRPKRRPTPTSLGSRSRPSGRRPARARAGRVHGITDARFYINQASIPTVICGPDPSRWPTPPTSGCRRRARGRGAGVRTHVRGVARVVAPRSFAAFAFAVSRRILGGMDITATTPLITITDAAAAKARALAERDGRPQAALRIRVTAGGCSGFSYELTSTTRPPRATTWWRVPAASGPDRPGQRPDRHRLDPRVQRLAPRRRPQDGEPAGQA